MLCYACFWKVIICGVLSGVHQKDTLPMLIFLPPAKFEVYVFFLIQTPLKLILLFIDVCKLLHLEVECFF